MRLRAACFVTIALIAAACASDYSSTSADGASDAGAHDASSKADGAIGSDASSSATDGGTGNGGDDAQPTGSGTDATPPGSGCIRFEACIDGQDDITVSGGQLSLVHIDFQLPGTHSTCSSVYSTVNPTLSLYEPDGGVIAVDGKSFPIPSLPAKVTLKDLGSFQVVTARGPVTMKGANTVELDDSALVTAAGYVVDLCP
jgi:hypothetical protein